MLRKMQLIFVFVLVALVSAVYAQGTLDVIYRDFPVTAYGFEEFMACDDKDNGNSPGIPVRIVGGRYTTEGNSGTILEYGECDNKKRGYKNGPDAITCNFSWTNPIKVTVGMVSRTLEYDKTNCKDDEQEDPDYKDNPRDFVKYRYCARPKSSGSDKCSSKLNPGNKVEQWFSSGGEARELRDVLDLEWNPTSRKYFVNYDYNTSRDWKNGDGNDNGFFPLDKYDDGSNKTWGRQSLNYWCPNKDEGNTSPDGICRDWYSNGGPRSPTAGRTTAQSRNVKNKLHNYGFSAAGSGQFKYDEKADDVFKFIGDDDMWIFIDGELAADLGGVHLAAPADINIKEYAKKTGHWSNRAGDVWIDGTTHVVNFFYMDRNTDGSNFKLEMALSGLAPPRFGAPEIKKAETSQKTDGSSSTVIYVNNKLDEESIKQFTTGEGKDLFPIVIKKVNDNNLYGFKLESISCSDKATSQGYACVINGQVCSSKTNCNGTLNSGDSLSFNVLFGELKEAGTPFEGLALPDDNGKWYIKTAGNKTPATRLSWAVNSTSMPPIIFKPDVADNDVRKPDFNIDSWFTGDPNGGKGVGGGSVSTGGGSLPGLGNKGLFTQITQIWDNKQNKLVDLPNGSGNNTVHGFGTKGTPIPPNRAGELILTAYPNAGSKVNGIPYTQWDTSSTYQKLFGLPPIPKDGNLFGIANPTEQQPNGGYIFVKNGFKGESSVGGIQVAPTRCIADRNELDIDGKAPHINCLNFSLKANRPFQISVTVYDQLGTFVTQYRETISEQEFRSVVQGPTFIEGNPGTGYVSPSKGKNRKDEEVECRYPTTPNDFGKKEIITTNGLVKVNVNIYPFSKDGRRFGNGVYILKIDRVDLPYEGCMNSNGSSVWIEEKFVRYHADTKFGWMRTNN